MQNNPNKFTKDAWEANADLWDSRMGDEGNDFFNILCWPVLASFLDPKPDSVILDIACGNGLTSRCLAARGADVTAFDFSSNLIEKAKERPNPDNHISYHVIDATNEEQLLSLGKHKFDSALSNMALFDMENIKTLFRALPKLLKPNGFFQMPTRTRLIVKSLWEQFYQSFSCGLANRLNSFFGIELCSIL